MEGKPIKNNGMRSWIVLLASVCFVLFWGIDARANEVDFNTDSEVSQTVEILKPGVFYVDTPE